MTDKVQLLRKLCERSSSPSPEMAIDEALKASFPDLQDLAPPVGLSRLAAARGVLDILRRNLDCDGVISETAKGSYIIQVSRNHAQTRTRFTIVHELGHTFFFDVDPNIRERVRDANLEQVGRLDAEEHLCNYAAAEILLPRKQFREALRTNGPSAKALTHLGKTFDVSVHATTRRLLLIGMLQPGTTACAVQSRFNQDIAVC